MREKLRALVQIVAGWTLTTILGLTLLAIIALSLGTLGESVGRVFLRAWGRGMLRVAGVDVVVEGMEHLAGRRPRVVLFNHSSSLDGFVVNAFLPDGGTPVAKRAFRWVPVIGWVMALGPILMVDRGNSERARATMEKAAREVQRKRLSVVIAPEGTRNHRERPARFKLGAFELARVTGAPIVPLVILGADRLMPYGSWSSKPGRLTVRILAPIDTSDYTRENLREKAEAMRALYRREMGPDAVD